MMSSRFFRATGILATFVLLLVISSSIEPTRSGRITARPAAAVQLLLDDGAGLNVALDPGEGPNVIQA